MSYLVIMTRINQFGTLNVRKEYSCPIPLNIIKEIALIEKREWRKFCFAPYYGLGKFIATHLDTYQSLKPYISLKTKAFDFTYQYLCDCSVSIQSIYISNDVEISEAEYHHVYSKQYYFEQWSVLDLETNKTLIFFEYEHLPSECYCK